MPSMGEIDLLDGFPVLEDYPLFEDDLLQVGEQVEAKSLGETRQQQVAPAGMGAIQLDARALMAEWTPHRNATALRPCAAPPAGDIGKPPVRNLSVRYPTKMLRTKDLGGTT